ncbi:unnamed protein product [Kluyveromyces dobzhanskii CBS 2104]|uniref:WGS project CCBQ000000000 data, contig 00058 n=1 Tax=Kluyveromyces dobzhanskii CBS 2104 TaxID=1427455 RepID=A0A0A8LBH1_9SACH|nr:unnamed protein product [Kluyveromyces dobzhanskii CBS 2104]
MDYIFKSISNFHLPFTTDGLSVVNTPFGTLENGTRKSDSLPITIHTYKTEHVPGLLLKNHILKCKVLKLPGLVRVLDVIELSADKVYIVTERITALNTLDYRKFGDNAMKLGIYQVAQTLHVLHEQGKSFFGALCLGNIYVNNKGEWVLYGLELSSNFNASNHFTSNVQVYNGVVRGYDDWQLGNCTTSSIDSIQLANLFNSLLSTRIPTSWKPVISQLAKGLPGAIETLISRMKMDSDNLLIFIYDSLKEIHIMESADKVMTLSNIQQKVTANDSALQNCTPGFLEFSLLPELTQCLQLLAATNQPTSTQVPFLGLIFHLTCSDDPIIPNEDVFQNQIKPLIFQSFNVADRQIRFLLLLHFPKVMQKLSSSEIADKIFPTFIQGLSDTDQVIKLQTLKNVSHLIGKITERQLNNDLLRVLAKTQVDKDIGIRTLTILIITRIAHKLNKSNNRSTILATAFTKSLKDPELRPRLATLYGLEITLDLFDAETIAQRILTVIGPGLLDRNKQVRSTAKKVFQMYWNKLEKESASVTEEDSSENIDTEEFERMMNDKEDGKLISGFIQSVKLSTPTPTSTPVVLTGKNDEVDPWNDAFDEADLDDSWDVEEPIVPSNKSEVKSFGMKVPVIKSWNDDLNEEENETPVTSKPLTSIRKPVLSKNKPSILGNASIKSSTFLKSKPVSHAAANKNTSKSASIQSKISKITLEDDDTVEDGWGDDW